MIRTLFKKLKEDALEPTRATPDSAGLDLYSWQSGHLRPREWAAVRTGIAIALPQGHAGFICPRSGLAVKHGVTVLNAPGIIDSDYRGEIRVLLINRGREPWYFEIGDRIGQLVVTPIVPIQLVEMGENEQLDETGRGYGGFGSTGR
jgi:dUTP pyrophosphatase